MRLILIADDEQSSFEVNNDLVKATLSPAHSIENDRELCEALRAGQKSLSGRPAPAVAKSDRPRPRRGGGNFR